MEQRSGISQSPPTDQELTNSPELSGPFSDDEIFRIMVLETPIPISIQDEQWRFVFVNEAYCRFTGYSANELIGVDPASMLFSPEEGATMLDIRPRINPADKTLFPEYPSVRELIRKDGQRVRFHVDLSISRTRSGDILWCGVVFDLTYLEQTREKLAQAERHSETMRFRFDNFAAHSTQAILVADPVSGAILYANQATWNIFDLPAPADVTATLESLWAHVAPEHQQALHEACQPRQPENTRLRITLKQNTPNERKLRVSISKDPRPGAEIYLTAEDITEKLQQHEQQRQAASQRRNVLIQEVQHRIKNNLQGVIGVLQSAQTADDSARMVLNDAIHKINAVAQVNDMLTNEHSDVAIHDLIKRLAEYLASAFGASIAVACDVGDPVLPPASFNYDAVPIALVMNEIITNAIKYNRTPDPIRVRTTCDATACIVSVCNEGKLNRQDVFETVGPDTHGLGLVKALLPQAYSRFTLRQNGNEVCATLWLDAALISHKNPVN